ncbi:response regulator [Varunaivibrio sulfuroxidans]|uniref:Regulatory protein VirG n=2 Tax=Varunaivibrio sulfuroxidans TaxID=1773489 RepID=A0A4R3J6A8_9PROT|nr:two-component system OmpR family response regulator [Varunaivibrio sulfuroxidans]
MSPHILVVDDDREIRDLVARFLGAQGYRVSTARDGGEMKQILETANITLIVLDLMMPGVDGLTLARDLRAGRVDIPIIMLTAMGEETDRIVGLEMGADDYLPKPFNPRELLARIKAVLRRAGAAPTQLKDVHRVTFEGWVLDVNRRELVSPKDVLVPLSGGEYELLRTLVTHAQRVLSRDQLLDMARGRDAQPFDRSIDVQISRLRKKIEDDPKEPRLIKTVRNGGYIFTPDVHVRRRADAGDTLI